MSEEGILPSLPSKFIHSELGLGSEVRPGTWLLDKTGVGSYACGHINTKANGLWFKDENTVMGMGPHTEWGGGRAVG